MSARPAPSAPLDPDLYRGLIFPRTLRGAFPVAERQTIAYATGRLPVIDPMPDEPTPRWCGVLWLACFVGAIVVSWLLSGVRP